eukprot:Opistho-1_new@37288
MQACPKSPNLIATWADTGRVHVWDMAQFISALDVPSDGRLGPTEPIFTFQGHPEEGFAMDWSTTVPGRWVAAGVWPCRCLRLHMWRRSAAVLWCSALGSE